MVEKHHQTRKLETDYIIFEIIESSSLCLVYNFQPSPAVQREGYTAQGLLYLGMVKFSW